MVKDYNVKASRKKSIARAFVKPGKGNIRINNMHIDAFVTGYKKILILEPTHLVPEEFSKLDFQIDVRGGGVSSQAQAIRNCIAKGIVASTGNKKSIKDKFIASNRYLLIDDVRNKEPKKQLGKGARKKKQKSKR